MADGQNNLLEEGDIVNVDYVGDSEAFSSGTAEDQNIDVQQFLPRRFRFH